MMISIAMSFEPLMLTQIGPIAALNANANVEHCTSHMKGREKAEALTASELFADQVIPLFRAAANGYMLTLNLRPVFSRTRTHSAMYSAT